MSRYARQEMLPQVGRAGQARLEAAHVLVVGAGGLAAPALPLLAGAGVGRITVIDPDRVELSNLHRQTLFSENEVGRPKAEAAADRCRALNSAVQITARVGVLTPANVTSLIRGVDVVLDCADSYAASYTLSDACKPAGVPLISASVLGMAGYAGGFCGSAPSLRAVFPEAPENTASCASAGVLGPAVALLGSLQAQMALSVLLDLAPSPLGQMVQVDAGGLRLSGFRFDIAPEPEAVLPFVDVSQLTPDDLVVELRDVTEAPAPLVSGALRLAPGGDLGAILNDAAPRAERIVLCCATGLRAWRLGAQLSQEFPGAIALIAAATSNLKD